MGYSRRALLLTSTRPTHKEKPCLRLSLVVLLCESCASLHGLKQALYCFSYCQQVNLASSEYGVYSEEAGFFFFYKAVSMLGYEEGQSSRGTKWLILADTGDPGQCLKSFWHSRRSLGNLKTSLHLSGICA